jgi:hypothetical protein
MTHEPESVRARYGWESDFPTFSDAEPRTVRISLEEFLADSGDSQIRAWDDSIPKIQVETGKVVEVDELAEHYTAILEYELPLESRRPDVVLLINGAVVVLELKGKLEPDQADLDQAAAYVRDLRCYHRHCADREVHAVVVPTRAPGYIGVRDGVHVCGPASLHQLIADFQRPWEDGPLTAEEFLAQDAYCPLPTLVQAARELFLEGKVRPIHRARAETQPAIDEIARIAHEAARTCTRHLVLVTGVPGSGKTLVGLSAVHNPALNDLAVERASGKPTAPGIFLSGNGPLVEVLQYELRSAGGGGKTFVRDVKNYVKQYLGDSKQVPPQHVIVYDEAQRAWDLEQVISKHSLPFPKSEPEAFVDFGERIPGWSVLVGLIGSGQEIHVGEEAGLGQWRTALEKAGDPESWTVHAPQKVLDTFFGPDWVSGRRLASKTEASAALELTVELRFHFAADLDDWVENLLEGDDPDHGAELAKRLEAAGYHLRMTRDLDTAKDYLAERYAEAPDARYGLLASSRDKVLEPDWDVPNGWHATQRVQLGPWYGEGGGDSRSCRNLNQCVTEFGAQGLELDAVLLAWGTDFIRVSAPDGSEHWSDEYAKRHQRGSHVKDPYQLRVNAYRVLLTRGRDAAVVFIPPDSRLDRTAARLQAHGVKMLSEKTPNVAAAPEVDLRRAETPPPQAPSVNERATPDEQSEHILDGVTYVWTGKRWYAKKTFLTPPTAVLDRLNVLVEVSHEVVPELPAPRPVKAGVIGAPPDITVGTVFPNRKALRDAGIHRPLQAGICGTGETGAESIVLNGGYEDDVDTRDEIIYTGHGGNDPASGQQIADQTLTGSNLSLVRSFEWELPVRVVRGWREPSGVGPKAGYRYDGLYRVVEHWEERGRSGFKIWRFRLVPFETER